LADAGSGGNAPPDRPQAPRRHKRAEGPTSQELADSELERHWIDAGRNSLAGKTIEFPGLELTITDDVVRVETLGGRKWTTIVHP
jgi:hypothetical protein